MNVKLKMPGLAAQIFLGLVLGIIVGGAFPELGKSLKPLGDIFIRMIKMIVVPLIFSSLVMGIAGTGDFKNSAVLAASLSCGSNSPRPSHSSWASSWSTCSNLVSALPFRPETARPSQMQQKGH